MSNGVKKKKRKLKESFLQVKVKFYTFFNAEKKYSNTRRGRKR